MPTTRSSFFERLSAATEPALPAADRYRESLRHQAAVFQGSGTARQNGVPSPGNQNMYVVYFGNCFLEFCGHFLALCGRYPSGAAVHDGTIPDRRIVAASGDIGFPYLHTEAEGLQNAASDLADDRIIAEQGQVPRTTAGGDTRPTGVWSPQAEMRASASMCGVTAVSSSVLPSTGKPPSPSSTAKMILELFF